MRLASVAIIILLAGCSNTPSISKNSPAEGYALVELDSKFTAAYAGDASARLIMGDASRIVDRDGQQRLAVPLTIELAEVSLRAWLSNEGRVVRWDEICKPASKICQLSSISWVVNGILPPFGVAWPQFIHGNEIQFQGHANRTLPVSWENGWLKVTNVGVRPDGFLDPPGRFHYDQTNAPLNITLEGRGGLLNFQRTSYVSNGPQAQHADPWPMQQWAPVLRVQDEIPGSDKTIGPWKRPAREFVATLREQDAEARAKSSTGCLTYLILSAPQEPQAQPPVGGPGTGVPIGRIEQADIQIANASGARKWVVQYQEFGISKFQVQPPQQEDNLYGCDHAFKAHATWPDAFERAKRLAPSNATLDFTYYLNPDDRIWDAEASPAIYDMNYVVGSRPTLGLNPHIALSATDGALEFLVMERSDLQQALAQTCHCSPPDLD